MFCIKVCFLGAGAGRSRAFKGGAGAVIFYIKPEPKKKNLEPEPKKKIWSRSREKCLGSATLLSRHKKAITVFWIFFRRFIW